MKKLMKSGILSMVMIMALGAASVQAFNSGTHLYIAEQVFPDCVRKHDLYYGSTAPDLAMFVSQPPKWPFAFSDTHSDFIDLRPFASGINQEAFAKGWLTHNEVWGADFYAHIAPGYVTAKAELLMQQVAIDQDFAHLAIEVAVDLLLKENDDPKLGEKLLKAVLFRSWQDRNLLVKALVLKEGRVDWLTLASAELGFRRLLAGYSRALSQENPKDKEALAEFGVQLARDIYGMSVTPQEVLALLELSMGLCQGDYKGAVDNAISGIQSGL